MLPLKYTYKEVFWEQPLPWHTVALPSWGLAHCCLAPPMGPESTSAASLPGCWLGRSLCLPSSLGRGSLCTLPLGTLGAWLRAGRLAGHNSGHLCGQSAILVHLCSTVVRRAPWSSAASGAPCILPPMNLQPGNQARIAWRRPRKCTMRLPSRLLWQRGMRSTVWGMAGLGATNVRESVTDDKLL